DYPYEPRAALDAEVEADACVIGAGVSGLACARELARRGLDTVVLEARTVASGASGRNGGVPLAGAAPFHVDARERWGPQPARRPYPRTAEAQREAYELANEPAAGDAVGRVHAARAVLAGGAAWARVVAGVEADGLELIAPAAVAGRVVHTLVDARRGYAYLQERAGGRIALGGFSALAGEVFDSDVEE